MILLKQDSLITDQTYSELLMQDTKVNILKNFEALSIQVSKSLRKGELVEMLASVFDEKPFYIINHLPEEEQKILSKLIACRQDEGVDVPTGLNGSSGSNGNILALQLHHLVVTKVDGDKQLLFMTNSIRQHIDRCAMKDLSVFPRMQEWKDNLYKLNELQLQIEQDVKFNPMTLPIERLPRYIQQLKDNIKSLDKLQKQLQRLEPQIKQYNIDFTTIYANIRESYRQCETKLGFMQMFKWG